MFEFINYKTRESADLKIITHFITRQGHSSNLEHENRRTSLVAFSFSTEIFSQFFKQIMPVLSDARTMALNGKNIKIVRIQGRTIELKLSKFYQKMSKVQLRFLEDY